MFPRPGRLALLGLLLLPWFTVASTPTIPGRVAVEIREGISDKKTWDFPRPEPTVRYTEDAFGFVTVPRKFSPKGILVDRSNPLLLTATVMVQLPAGEYRILLRSRGAARLHLGEDLVLETEFLKNNASGHESVPEAPAVREEGIYALPIAHQEKLALRRLDGGRYTFLLEAFVGGTKLRPEVGTLCVCIARAGEPFRVLSPTVSIPFTEEGWTRYAEGSRGQHQERDELTRRQAGAREEVYWRQRHELARQETAKRGVVEVPRVGKATPTHNEIDRFVGQKLEKAGVQAAPLTDDLAFLRRVTLDIQGVVPTPEQLRAFRADQRPDRRRRLIDQLLADSRWADNWIGYWQDVLAENPGILKPTLNNTGPFRWWLHQAFRDNLPMDRFVTELVLMEGSRYYGAPGGFAVATENDAPMASKAHILAKAFLGLEMQCARCHDAPYHPYKQEQLFNLAALLSKGAQTLPQTSTVKFVDGGRKPRVTVSLRPGDKIAPAWPFADLAAEELPEGILREKNNPRERFAALLTSPHNERFAQVLVNRLWKRYLGWGIVEPVDDWHDAKPSHPELLAWLGRELITHDYDLKHVARLILNSHTYQRQVRPEGSLAVGSEERLFASPSRRRLSAEQLIDSLFLVAGKEFRSEELTVDPEGRRPLSEMLNLGTPKRAWEFTSLSNERDRPALALPMAQSIVDLLVAYGWRDSRQNPLTIRDETPTALQPLLLANGIVGSRITRLSEDSAFTALCLEEQPLPTLIERLCVRVLNRPPSAAEQELFLETLREGYETRRTAVTGTTMRKAPARATAVSWANHLSPEATKLKLELERTVREGDPPTPRLTAAWRERMEDVLWALINTPEFVFVP